MSLDISLTAASNGSAVLGIELRQTSQHCVMPTREVLTMNIDRTVQQRHRKSPLLPMNFVIHSAQ
jgi:hypothetical protein